MDRWFIHPCDLEGQQRLSKALGLHRATAQALINRGIDSCDAAQSFLKPELKQLPDPFAFPDMEKAVERIARALKQGEKIAIYGDYDVDGLTGTALMVRFLRELGQEPLVYIPHRLTEGYGLNHTAIETLARQKVTLIITVDCGSRSEDLISIAREKGVEIIVTDHHEVGSAPADYILLNPKREGVASSQQEIAGCAMAYFLLAGLQKYLIQQGVAAAKYIDLTSHLDLVALGTIADIVPLRGVNRILAKFGLVKAMKSDKPGLTALIKNSGLKEGQLKTGTVAFRLAPRINAAGRLGEAMHSLKLLTTDDNETAKEMAQALNRFNAERQRLEESVLNEAMGIVEEENLSDRAAIVVASPNWHPGVVGIVASKLVERYALPAVVISLAGQQGKGSARSVSGLNIVSALEESKEYLKHFGGHALAAGLTLDPWQLADFQKRFETVCEKICPAKTERILSIDAMLHTTDLTPKLAYELDLMEPFGLGNPEPVFGLEDLTITDHRVVGNNHLKLKVAAREAAGRFDSIGFGMADKALKTGQCICLAFTPQMNTWNGLTSLQLKIKDILCSK